MEKCKRCETINEEFSSLRQFLSQWFCIILANFQAHDDKLNKLFEILDIDHASFKPKATANGTNKPSTNCNDESPQDAEPSAADGLNSSFNSLLFSLLARQSNATAPENNPAAMGLAGLSTIKTEGNINTDVKKDDITVSSTSAIGQSSPDQTADSVFDTLIDAKPSGCRDFVGLSGPELMFAHIAMAQNNKNNIIVNNNNVAAVLQSGNLETSSNVSSKKMQDSFRHSEHNGNGSLSTESTSPFLENGNIRRRNSSSTDAAISPSDTLSGTQSTDPAGQNVMNELQRLAAMSQEPGASHQQQDGHPTNSLASNISRGNLNKLKYALNLSASRTPQSRHRANGPYGSFTVPTNDSVQRYNYSDFLTDTHQCRICHAQLKNHMSAIHHVRRIHIPGGKRYPCSFCTRTFYQRSHRDKHSEVVHGQA